MDAYGENRANKTLQGTRQTQETCSGYAQSRIILFLIGCVPQNNSFVLERDLAIPPDIVNLDNGDGGHCW